MKSVAKNGSYESSPVSIKGQISFAISKKDSKKLKLVHLAPVPQFFGFLEGQIGFMKDRGFEVHAVSSPGELLWDLVAREEIQAHTVTIPRFISPVADLHSLHALHRLFLHVKPAIVHAHTLKGGLLGVIAARWAGVPVVIYGMHGTRFHDETGLNRLQYILWERLTCGLADGVIAVSFSNQARTIEGRLCNPKKVFVPGLGSTNGLDALDRFNPEKFSGNVREEIRRKYQIPPEASVIGFVSRIVKFKGIMELEEAWQTLRHEFPNLYLLLVGAIEKHYPIPPHILERLETDPRVRMSGFVRDPALLYSGMDLFAYPSHREGFPISPLEAAAMNLPVVTTFADGCRDAVVNGVTGILVPARDSLALTKALRRLLLDERLRRQMGKAGRERVLRDFQQKIIWSNIFEIYVKLLQLKLPNELMRVTNS